MLWILGKQAGKPESDSRKKLVLAVCACARISLPYIRKGDERPRIAIETAEAYARGEGPTLAQVGKATADAYAADAADAACAAARKTALNEYANVVRKHYPEPPTLANL